MVSETPKPHVKAVLDAFVTVTSELVTALSSGKSYAYDASRFTDLFVDALDIERITARDEERAKCDALIAAVHAFENAAALHDATSQEDDRGWSVYLYEESSRKAMQAALRALTTEPTP